MTKEALKLALEAFGEIEWSNNSQWQSDRAKVAITAIKEALAQPNFCPRCNKRLGTNDWDIHTCTPPQRTWVGLTDDELFKIWMGAPSETEDRFAFVKVVIVKLKELNT